MFSIIDLRSALQDSLFTPTMYIDSILSRSLGVVFIINILSMVTVGYLYT